MFGRRCTPGEKPCDHVDSDWGTRPQTEGYRRWPANPRSWASLGWHLPQASEEPEPGPGLTAAELGEGVSVASTSALWAAKSISAALSL